MVNGLHGQNGQNVVDLVMVVSNLKSVSAITQRNYIFVKKSNKKNKKK
jgi:hypothetical protein